MRLTSEPLVRVTSFNVSNEISEGLILFRRCLFTVACLAGLSGCNPLHTRAPDLVPRTSEEDKALWNYHDPFPDDSQGPTTDHRPAGGRLQRTMPRQALEKDSMTIRPRGLFEPARPEARLDAKTANVVQP